MTVRDDLLEAVGNLLIGLTDAVDAKVIAAGEKGPRPSLPYVTLRVTSVGGGQFGLAQRLDGLNGSTPQATMQERREAVVSLQGYGADAYGWLDRLQVLLDSPGSLTLQAVDGIAALLQSPVADISQLLDTSEETRSSLELRLRYQYRSPAQDQVELLRTEVTLTAERYTGDPDTLSADFALDGSGSLTTPP